MIIDNFSVVNNHTMIASRQQFKLCRGCIIIIKLWWCIIIINFCKLFLVILNKSRCSCQDAYFQDFLAFIFRQNHCFCTHGANTGSYVPHFFFCWYKFYENTFILIYIFREQSVLPFTSLLQTRGRECKTIWEAL